MDPKKTVTSTAEFSQTILSAQTPQVVVVDSSKSATKKSGGKQDPPPDKENPKED